MSDVKDFATTRHERAGRGDSRGLGLHNETGPLWQRWRCCLLLPQPTIKTNATDSFMRKK